jgi:lysine 6-dehydrogenase
MADRPVLVLGAGLQGRAVLEYLERHTAIDRIVAADADLPGLKRYLDTFGARRIEPPTLDAGDQRALHDIVSGAAVVVNMLPPTFAAATTEACIARGAHEVNTNYSRLVSKVDAEAVAAGVSILPESGFDPGVDLVLAGCAKAAFDRLDSLVSYGSGIPAPECRDENPLRYKISWTFAGVLRVYKRPAKVLLGGRAIEIPGADIFFPPWTHELDWPGLGRMEAYVNSDAVAIAEQLDIRESVRTMARYTCRWPGHCDFWGKISRLGLLDETPPAGGGTSPAEFLRRHLEPRLQYGPQERDLVLLRLEAIGTRAGKRCARRWDFLDYRDLATGFFAMNRAVGYPAAITAEMLLSGAITRRGVLSMPRDVPAGPFLARLAARGMKISEYEVDPDECFRQEAPAS